MHYTTFGRTGLKVSRIAFGAGPIGYLDSSQEKAGQVHQENATTPTFHNLKPESPVGKGMELTEDVADAANRVVKGVTGSNPGKYIQETLEGKNSK